MDSPEKTFTCPSCKGTGEPYEVNGIIHSCACNKCPDCHGKGHLTESEVRDKKKSDEEANEYLATLRAGMN